MIIKFKLAYVDAEANKLVFVGDPENPGQDQTYHNFESAKTIGKALNHVDGINYYVYDRETGRYYLVI